jgi:integrase
MLTNTYNYVNDYVNDYLRCMIKVKFVAGAKVKLGYNTNLVITGLANIATTNKSTRYTTTTGVILNDLSKINTDSRLLSIKTDIIKTYEKATATDTLNEFTRITIKDIISKATNRQVKNVAPITNDSFFYCLDYYIQTKGGYNIVNKNDVKESTLKIFKTLGRQVMGIDANLKLSQIDHKFLDKFKKSYSKQSKSTYVKMFKALKVILKFANHKKINLSSNTIYNEMEIDSKDVEATQTKNVYSLSKEDLNELFYFTDFEKTSNPAKAEIIRDVFIFMCMTGIRVSDLKDIAQYNVDGIDHMSIITQKTGKPCKIPLNRTASEILTRYDKLLSLVIDADINIHIKEIGKALKWNDKTELFKIGANDTRIKRADDKLKYERLSTKVARKTFATLLDDNGYNSQSQLMMGFEPKGIFEKHYNDSSKKLKKCLEAVRTIEI